MNVPRRGRPILQAAVELPTPRKKPDPALPLFAAAFFLGVVITAVAGLALRVDDGDVVPAGTHQATVTQLAAERAAHQADRDRLAAQDGALQDAEALARRLIAAMDTPPVSAAELAALRRDVARQSERIERVRVVRVPVPGPVVTVPASPQRPQTARRDPAPPPAAPSPAPQPPGCTISLLGTCLAR